MMRSLYRRDSAEFDRALAFFDAIYGFSLTLLVANIDIPPPRAWRSLAALLDHGLGTQLLGFLISFVVIVAFWYSNHQLVARLSGLNSGVVMVNVITAGLVIFIPFSTQGISDPATADLPLPNVLYAVNISLAILSQIAMFELAGRRALVTDPDPPAARRARLLDSLLKPTVFLGSIPVAYAASGNAAKWCWLVLAVAGPLTGRLSNNTLERATNGH